MRVGPFHLTYCSNIHAGERWSEVSAALAAHLPDIRARLAANGPMAIGLRLSAAAAETLAQPGELSAFRAFLADGGYYVFTINGFPFGAFHGTRVKENVYLPDWHDRRRLEYSNRLADIMAALLPDDVPSGSVSTVPGAFRRTLTPESAGGIATMVWRHAAHLVALEQRTGRRILLALEPEPACFLETTDDAVRFFSDWLFDARRLREAQGDIGAALTVEQVRAHVGLCYDACHMAVQFEDHARSLSALEAAGITIAKVQVTSGLHLAEGAGATVEQLAGFAEDTYLHQVVQHDAGTFARYDDLPEALAASAANPSASRQWRVHFHVPVHRGGAGALGTTQTDLERLLELVKQRRTCPYFEVETYTWSVLSPSCRAENLAAEIAAELAWTREVLVR